MRESHQETRCSLFRARALARTLSGFRPRIKYQGTIFAEGRLVPYTVYEPFPHVEPDALPVYRKRKGRVDVD